MLAISALLLHLSIAFAQEVVEQTPPVTSAVVPVVGAVQGVGDAVWRTAVTIQNTTGADVFVAVRLLASEESLLSTDLASGDSLSFTDISQEAFGKTGILSPLLIQTVGNRSVLVSAVAYAVQGDRASASQTIPVIYGAPPSGNRWLGPVTFNENFRTNIGLVNLGDAPATFTLSVQRIAGRNLAVNTVTVAPRSLIHSPLQILFPLLTEGSDLTVVVDPGASNTYAYASMIRNSDLEARFFAPR